MKSINILSGQNAELPTLKTGYHWVLKGYISVFWNSTYTGIVMSVWNFQMSGHLSFPFEENNYIQIVKENKLKIW
jgi:hypothetical protein